MRGVCYASRAKRKRDEPIPSRVLRRELGICCACLFEADTESYVILTFLPPPPCDACLKFLMRVHEVASLFQ